MRTIPTVHWKIVPLLSVLLLLAVVTPVGTAMAAEAVRLEEIAASVEFPDKVTFQALARSAIPIARAELRFRVEKRSCGAAVGSGLASVTPANGQRLEWEWNLKEAGGLPVGTRVEYWWVVTDREGDVTTSPRETFIFNDPRFEWRSLGGQHIVLHWYAGAEDFAQELLAAAEDGISRLEAATGALPSKPVGIWIYENSAVMREALVFPQEFAGGVAFPPYGLVAIGVGESNLAWGKRAMVHEMTHVVLDEITHFCGSDIPAWLNEGLAVYNEGPVEEVLTNVLNRAKSQDRLFTTTGLRGSFPPDYESALLAYAESHAWVRYLVQTYGPEKMGALLTTFRQLGSIDVAMTRVYGFDQASLYAKWREAEGLLRSQVQPLAPPAPRPLPTVSLFGPPSNSGSPLESSANATPEPPPSPTPPPLPPTPTLTPTSGGSGCNRNASGSAGLDVTTLGGMALLALRRRKGPVHFTAKRLRAGAGSLACISSGLRRFGRLALKGGPLVLIALAIFMAACGRSPSPTPTLVSTPALEAAKPTATPSDAPPPPPMPGGAQLPFDPLMSVPDGFQRLIDYEQGFAFAYPTGWRESVVGNTASTTSVIGPDGWPQVTVFTALENDADPLAARLDALLEQFGEGIGSYEIERRQDGTLKSGAPSSLADLTYERETGRFKTRLQVAADGLRTVLMIATAPAAVLERQFMMNTTFESLVLFRPSPFGVPADRALTMPWNEPITLDPAMSRDTRSHLFVSHLYSGLVRLDKEMRIQPDLAESWQFDASGTVVTFRLREGIAFHDGTPITAEDVKYALERAAAPELQSPTAFTYLGDILGVREKLNGDAKGIRGVTVVDPRTVRIEIDAPKAYFLAKLTYPTAAVVDRRNVEAGGHEWWRQPNGSGPFKLREWLREERVVLERFDAYRPSPSKLEFAAFPLLAGVPMRMYQAGLVDVSFLGGSEVDRALDPASDLADQLEVFSTFSVDYLGFNTQKPPFDDPLVRRAFAMALDRDTLTRVVFDDQVQPARGILPPGMPGHDGSYEGLGFDPEEAKRLLAASRYGGPDGLPPVVWTSPGFGEISADLAFIIDGWKRHLGVEVTVRQMAPAEYIYRVQNEVDNLFDFGWSADYPDPENFLDILFHSANRENNVGGYASATFDDLVERARTEASAQRRINLYQQAERLMVEDAAAIPLYYSRRYTLVKPHVSGFEIGPLGIPALQDVAVGNP